MTRRTKKRIEELERRIELLEFEKIANGNKYVFGELSLDENGGVFRSVKWIYNKKVCYACIRTDCHYEEITRNGYIEVYNCLHNYIVSVYKAEGDKLKNVDIDLYTKAYPTKNIIVQDSAK